MLKTTRKELITKFTLRVYNKDEAELLNKALKTFEGSFSSTNDAIKYFACMGADKLLGNKQMDNSINFSEIRRYMKDVDDKLEKIEQGQKSYFAETTGEVLTNQAMTNLNTKLLLKSTGINLQSHSKGWKYEPKDYDLEQCRKEYKKDLLDGRR